MLLDTEMVILLSSGAGHFLVLRYAFRPVVLEGPS